MDDRDTMHVMVVDTLQAIMLATRVKQWMGWPWQLDGGMRYIAIQGADATERTATRVRRFILDNDDLFEALVRCGGWGLENIPSNNIVACGLIDTSEGVAQRKSKSYFDCSPKFWDTRHLGGWASKTRPPKLMYPVKLYGYKQFVDAPKRSLHHIHELGEDQRSPLMVRIREKTHPYTY